MHFLWKRIQSWVNKRGNGQLTSNHQPATTIATTFRTSMMIPPEKSVLQGNIAARLSKGMDQQQADDKHCHTCHAMNRDAADFDPPDRRTTDMSPKG